MWVRFLILGSGRWMAFSKAGAMINRFAHIAKSLPHIAAHAM
jgi:hypothetical protein